jgi:hypothetical protein
LDTKVSFSYPSDHGPPPPPCNLICRSEREKEIKMAASVVSLYPRVSFVVNFIIEFFIQELIEKKKKTLVGGGLCMGGVGNN